MADGREVDRVLVVYGTNPNNDKKSRKPAWISEMKERALAAANYQPRPKLILTVGGESVINGGAAVTEAEMMRMTIETICERSGGDMEVEVCEGGLETIAQTLAVANLVKDKGIADPLLVVISAWHQCIRAALVLESLGYSTERVYANSPKFDIKTVNDVWKNFTLGAGYTALWVMMQRMGRWKTTSPMQEYYRKKRQFWNKTGGKIQE